MEPRQWTGDEGLLAETVMDVLSQACGNRDGTLNDCCLSAYEDAFDCLASFGLAEPVEDGRRWRLLWDNLPRAYTASLTPDGQTPSTDATPVP